MKQATPASTPKHFACTSTYDRSIAERPGYEQSPYDAEIEIGSGVPFLGRGDTISRPTGYPSFHRTESTDNHEYRTSKQHRRDIKR